MTPSPLTRLTTPEAVRDMLRQRQEIALIDLREEDAFARGHPLFAAQLPLRRLADDAPWRLPRRGVPVVLMDDGEGLVEPAAQWLQAAGWTNVSVLEGGLHGWRRSGGELFIDVNVPSKAFGELVEHERGTPSLPAPEVKALLDSGADVVVLDARRFDEYQTMSIPRGVSVPGGELLLRARSLAPDPRTHIIVNCAGRTRSLIGAQTLVNAGLPNPVHALRNGTIGWLLAGQTLQHGAQRRFGSVDATQAAVARSAAQALAAHAGAQRIDAATLASWLADATRTLYRWDVRTPEEYAAGHRPGFGSAPGGQLVQETDVFAAVRGARIVLSDDDGVRASVTAHWLAQMGWEVAWLDDTRGLTETGPWQPVAPGGQPWPGPRTHRYQRPYEGTDAPRAAMQAYLDWEFGLVAQLARDGTHGFAVLCPPDAQAVAGTSSSLG
ncbi:MAG: thiosulfate sulfurtransferase [Rubrivivax sp.]|nr:thiosulfate sulfurtransferase [Rubrivivax sp.]